MIKFFREIGHSFQTSSNQLGLTCGILAALVFLFDIFIPQGFAFGVLYVGVVLLSQWSSSKKFILVNTVSCSGLNMLGFLFSPKGFDIVISLSNRILALFAIWVSAVLIINREELLKIKNIHILEQGRVWENLSKMDELTGISNRRNYEEYLNREWRRSVRESAPISLIMADIDFFKNYNDFYGHLKGDACLKRIAETMKNTLNRPGDMVGRYGGEEFIIVLPNTRKNGAKKIAELLRRKVEDLCISHSKSQVKPVVTISLGSSTCIPNHRDTVKLLISATDQALYQAKQKGRNRVVVLDVTKSENILDPDHRG